MLLDEWLSVGDWDWEDDVSSRTRAEVRNVTGLWCRCEGQHWGIFSGGDCEDLDLKATGVSSTVHSSAREGKKLQSQIQIYSWLEGVRKRRRWLHRKVKYRRVKKKTKKNNSPGGPWSLAFFTAKQRRKKNNQVNFQAEIPVFKFFFFLTLIVKRKIFVFCHNKVNN